MGDDQRPGRRQLAVVGSGIAGLTAAYVLQRHADVTLYEADARLGGHSHTHDVLDPGLGRLVAVDSGFIVHNAATYPILLRLFAELGIQTQETEMSMSVSCAGCGLEYAGARGARGLFAQPRSLARASYLRMLTEVPRFHRAARRLLAAADPATGFQAAGEPAGPPPDQPLGDFLAAGGYSPYFVQHFMTPLVAAVWSCSAQTASRYPARYLFTFLANHGMLSITGSPAWRTVVGGSRTYVERLVKELSAVLTATPVRAVRRLPGGGVEITDADDSTVRYDGVVVATHPDQALSLLADATAAEREVLGAFRYSRNETLLHTDASVLPDAPAARASWNYRMASCQDAADRVLVSYDMTRLQRLPTETRYVVSLGSADRVDPSCVLEAMTYEHPIYTPESVAAQQRLPELTTPSFALAGAWHGWGFHEDGARSGLAAAKALGGTW